MIQHKQFFCSRISTVKGTKEKRKASFFVCVRRDVKGIEVLTHVWTEHTCWRISDGSAVSERDTEQGKRNICS